LFHGRENPRIGSLEEWRENFDKFDNRLDPLRRLQRSDLKAVGGISGRRKLRQPPSPKVQVEEVCGIEGDVMKIFTQSIMVIAIMLGSGLPGSVAHAQPAVMTVPAYQPAQGITSQMIPVGSFVSNPNLVLFVVPAGKRLIVEHFSAETAVASGISVNRFFLAAANPNTALHFIAPTYNAPCGGQCTVSGQTTVVASQPIRLYADAGQQLIANVAFSGGVGAGTLFAASFSGYLVDAP
jgi:hypothetical protein